MLSMTIRIAIRGYGSMFGVVYFISYLLCLLVFCFHILVPVISYGLLNINNSEYIVRYFSMKILGQDKMFVK